MARYSKIERLNRIVEMIDGDHNLTINYLSDYFSVSSMTIRRDIDELQKEGVVKVIFGGQIVKNYIEISPLYNDKIKANINYKKNIALKAYKFLQPGQTVFMDGGTTINQLASLIDIPITVITNDIVTAQQLSKNNMTKVILCPGEIAWESLSAYSSETLRYLTEHYFDIAFIGADGFSKKYGALTTTQIKADCKMIGARQAMKSILMVDHSKKNVFCKYKIADLECFDLIITDTDE